MHRPLVEVLEMGSQFGTVDEDGARLLESCTISGLVG